MDELLVGLVLVIKSMAAMYISVAMAAKDECDFFWPFLLWSNSC